MKKCALLLASSLIVSLVVAHDMWLEPHKFFVSPGEIVTIQNGNGTIYKVSENAVTPDRVSSVALMGPEGEIRQLDKLDVSGNYLEFQVDLQSPGNYWVGLATRSRPIQLTGDEFNEYLEHDGLPHVLKERKEKGISDRAEIEQYSKYVKTYLQVGEERSQNFSVPLGLEIEIVPQRNPYSLGVGQELPIQVLFRGAPLEGFVVHAGFEGQESEGVHSYTDAEGRATITLGGAGKWYIRGIHLFQVDAADHSYESYWATLTFAVAPEHPWNR